MGWVFRGGGGQGHPRERLNLPDTGNPPREPPRFPIIRDPDGVEEDSEWEYVEKGLAEGWLIETHDHRKVIRDNVIAYGIVYYLVPPD